MSMGGFIFRGVVLCALAMSPAFADSSKKPPPAPADVTLNQPVAVAGAAAASKSEAEARALAASHAEGGEAKAASVATGGKAKGGDAEASANSGGNELTVNERHVRQAPGLAQGSFAIVGCGVAANAGGSNVGGAAFLGFGFTPSQCYDFMLANAYCTAGATEACCEVLNNSKAGRRAQKRGVRLPECRQPEPPPPTVPAPTQPPVVVVTPCCEKPEPQECPPDNRCYEKCDKACKHQCQGNAECEQRCERLCKRRCDGEPPGPAGAGGASCPNPTGK